MGNWRGFILFIFLFLACRWSGASQVVMAVGDQKIIRAAGKGSITVTNNNAVKVLMRGGALHLIARHPGFSQIMFSKSRAMTEVAVLNAKTSETMKTIEPWLKSVFGLELEAKPDHIAVSGHVLRLQDWRELVAFKKRFGATLVILAKPAPRIEAELARAVDNSIKERSLSSARAIVQGDGVKILTSAKAGGPDAQLAHEIARDWGLENAGPSRGLELRPMVEIEVVIAELKKNAFRSLGLKPPGVYSATVLPAPDLRSTAVTFNSFMPEFHALFTQDSGKVLANPKLLCRSGESAHFVAGGEIPIKILNWKNSDVVWKKYGVILDITPQADLNEGISAKIVTEVSLLDEAHKVDGIPGLFTNRIETHVDLRGSKTIALSGLIKSEFGRNTTGTPLLGDIPVLGELFKSRDYKDNRTELVVFLTPRVVSPDNPPPPPSAPHWEWDDAD